MQTALGHSAYRGKQKEVIEAAVLGADVLVLAPTGMGKVSRCFLTFTITMSKHFPECLFSSTCFS
jgi:superfamily II DNA helicase RecQ